MDPIKKLMDEHLVILRGIDILEQTVTLIDNNGDVNPELFRKLIDFIRNYADKYHHAKEEDILFIKMQDCGFPLEGGPIEMMLIEHDQGRKYVKGIEDGVELSVQGNVDGKNQIIENSLGFAVLLRNHIHKEDNVLYPMAVNGLGQDVIDSMIPDFEKVDEVQAGVEGKYIKLLDELETS
jgi:hemerythrin-like domain-containing protein